MADQNDQNENPPPAEDPTFLHLSSSAMAEKTLPGFQKPAQKYDSDYSSSSDEEGEDMEENCISEEVRNQKIQELQIKAYTSVVDAFTSFTSISDERKHIILRLMNEFKITPETHEAITTDLVSRKPRGVSVSPVVQNDMQIVQNEPLIKPQPVRATSRFVSVATGSGSGSGSDPMLITIPQQVRATSSGSGSGSGSGWGSVDPYSLVGKSLRVKLHDEEVFDEFIIKEYDPKQDMHRLETKDSNGTEMEDDLSWMDLRQYPPQDLLWDCGYKPDFGGSN